MERRNVVTVGFFRQGMKERSNLEQSVEIEKE